MVEVKECHTIAETLDNRMRAYADRECIGVLRGDAESIPELEEELCDDTYHSYITYRSLYGRCRRISTRLRQKSHVRQRICIIGSAGDCAVDWITVEFMCVVSGYISVPLHTTFTKEQIASVIECVGVTMVFCSEAQHHKVRANGVPVVVFGSPSWKKLVNPYGLPPARWLRIVPAKSPDTIITLFHTSGSTGTPKGVIICDRQLNELVGRGSYAAVKVNFCYKPLGYSTQRKALYRKLCCGGKLIVHSGNMETLFREARVACPTTFSGPPRIWSLLYTEYKARVHQLRQLPENADTSTTKLEEDTRLLFSKALGPNCEQVSTGGAIVPPDLLKWMKSTFSEMSVNEGYGCSECGSIARHGKKNAHTKVRLESIPELGYLAEQGKGLLWVCNPGASRGYFGDESKTKEMFRLFPDGNTYYNTGDVVDYNESTGDLKVIDRVKNLLRLSSAVFIAPEYLENIYSECDSIAAMFVYGESTKDYILAVVRPNRSFFKGIDDVASAVMSDIRACAQRNGLQPYQVPRALIIENELWTPEKGLLTPTFKLKRLSLTAKYRDALAGLYRQLESSYGTCENSVEGVIRSVLKTSKPSSGKERLLAFGVDSVAIVHLQARLSMFGKKPPLSLMLTGTIAQIKAYVTEKREEEEVHLDWSQETTLPDDLLPADHADFSQGNDVFITGGTGFLGIFVLAESLSRFPQSSCLCLVRASSQSEAMQRLKQSAATAQLSLDWGRVTAIPGDLALPRFGLPDFEELIPRVQLVIHCGAHVNGIFPYQLLRAVNVQSAIECLKLQSRMIFVSSLSALSGSDQPTEEFSQLSLAPLSKKSGYGASKRVAEILLHQAAMQLGYDVTIVRPGTIGGTFPAGVFNTNDTLPRFIQSIVQMGCAPRLNNLVSAVDVRVVASICCRAESGVYHVRGHSGLSVTEIGECLGLTLVPFNSWKMRLLNCDPSNSMYAIREAYFKGGSFPLGSSHQFDDSRSTNLVPESARSRDISPQHIISWARWLSTFTK